ncbi:MAG: chloride channel protein [Bryobacterales bacterium]|nr:chloride channel protein [Bryobacterales bacterium]
MRTIASALAHLSSMGRAGPVLDEPQRFLLLSIVIGIFSGLVVVCFHISLELLNWVTVHPPVHSSWYVLPLWPAAGGLAAYALVHFVVPTARGSSVNYTKAAVYASDGYISFRGVLGKFASCTLSIGTGNPMGPEDPSLQMGAGIASLLGRIFHLTRNHMRLIAPIGAAAGIGAAFNTPIAAVLFVMEEVVSAWNAGVLGSIVLASVSAVVVSRWFLGDSPLYTVPEIETGTYAGLLAYAAIGASGGTLSAVFTKRTVQLRGKVLNLRERTRVLLPALAGLLAGLAGLFAPEILGAGYQSVEGALHDRFPWGSMLALAALKLALTAVCFSFGTPGGLFAPTLFVGAMLGGGLGVIAQTLMPGSSGSVGAYVLVGIGAFFAGVFRAPMTSVFMVFELSASYTVILPVMIANTVAFFVARRLEPRSVFELTGLQDGLDLPSADTRRETPAMHVEDAMQRGRGRVAASGITVEQALGRLAESEERALLVELRYGTWRWIGERPVRRAAWMGEGETPLRDTQGLLPVVRTYPDVPLDQAMRQLAIYPVLPVTSRVNPNALVGTLTLGDVHRAYGILTTGPSVGGQA